MGLFSGILSGAGQLAGNYIGGLFGNKSLGASIGASIGGGLSSSMGESSANAASRQMAQDKMNFEARQVQQQEQFQRESVAEQERYQSQMSGTAYQRAVTDLKTAGLNPMLAYQQGGASTPAAAAPSGAAASGAMGVAGNVGGAGVAGAAQAAQMSKELSLLDSQKNEIDSRVALNNATLPRLAADAQLSLASAGRIGALLPFEKLTKEHEVGKAAYDDSYYTTLWNRIPELVRIYVEQQAGNASVTAQQYEQRQKAFPFEQLMRQAQSELEGLKLPQARSEAAMHESGYGKVRPYLQDVGDYISGASRAKNLFGR